MLTRLLLTLLAACLSLPAIGAPVSHGAPMEQTAHAAPRDCHESTPQSGEHGQHQQKHECIGCIARYDGMAQVATTMLSPEPLPEMQFAAQHAQIRAGPDTPPPRS